MEGALALGVQGVLGQWGSLIILKGFPVSCRHHYHPFFLSLSFNCHILSFLFFMYIVYIFFISLLCILTSYLSLYCLSHPLPWWPIKEIIMLLLKVKGKKRKRLTHWLPLLFLLGLSLKTFLNVSSMLLETRKNKVFNFHEKH